MNPPSNLRLYEKIAKLVPGIVSVYNLKTGEYIYINDSITKILGYSKKQLLTGGIQFLLTLIHPDDVERVVNENLKAQKSAESKKTKDSLKDCVVQLEFRIKHTDGHYRWLKTDGVTFNRNDQGQVENVMTISVDITSLKEAELKEINSRKAFEEALITNEAKFRTLIQESTDAIQLIDEKGNIVYTSDSVEKVLGYKPQEIENHGPSQYIHPQDIDKFFKVFSSLLTKPGKQVTLEYRVKHKNGSWVWVEATGVNHLHNPAIKAIVGNFRNITERKLLEKQKEEFLGVVSHELKTPLTSIKAYTQILQKRFNTSGDISTAKMLRKMDKQINKLSGLIQDLLDASKIESGKFKLQKGIFNYGLLVQEVVENIQMTTNKHQIIIKQNTRHKIFADRERIGQVLSNLILNAIKYTPQKSKIYITFEIKDANFVTGIKDSGVGIPKNKQAHIFQRFYRIENNTTDAVPGIGLGLNIASQIIKMHDGEIWFDSTLGKGSIFYFSLPLNHYPLRQKNK